MDFISGSLLQSMIPSTALHCVCGSKKYNKERRLGPLLGRAHETGVLVATRGAAWEQQLRVFLRVRGSMKYNQKIGSGNARVVRKPGFPFSQSSLVVVLHLSSSWFLVLALV
jgi:hypothetical protein